MLNHDMYKSCLNDGIPLRLQNTRIQSKNHILETIRTNKVSLSAFDDKRWISADKINTLPYGHYSLTKDTLTDSQLVNAVGFGNQSFVFSDSGTEPAESNAAGFGNHSFVFSDSGTELGECSEQSTLPATETVFNSLDQNIVETFLDNELNVLPNSPMHEGQADNFHLSYLMMGLVTTPDPGFNQRTYSESELEEVLDLENLPSDDGESDHREDNPFIVGEAAEGPAEKSPDVGKGYEGNYVGYEGAMNCVSPSTPEEMSDFDENVFVDLEAAESSPEISPQINSKRKRSEESPIIQPKTKRRRAYIMDSD